MDKEQLIRAGIDYETGLGRFANKPELYHKFLLQFAKEEYLEKQMLLMKNRQVQDAFQAAHTIKGIFGTLGMNQLYQLQSLVVEELRRGKLDEAVALLPGVENAYHMVVEVILQWDSQE